MKTYIEIVIILFLSFVVMACTTIVRDHPVVLEVREAYLSAEQDNQVVRMAPVALEEAKESLDKTERLAQKFKIIDKKAFQKTLHLASLIS